MKTIIFYIILLGCLFTGCRSWVPKQPALLEKEKSFFDSLHHHDGWDKIERTVMNIDAKGEWVWGADKIVTWKQTYEYSIEFTTKDSIIFIRIDSTYIDNYYRKLRQILPNKTLKSISIYTRHPLYQDAKGVSQYNSRSFEVIGGKIKFRDYYDWNKINQD